MARTCRGLGALAFCVLLIPSAARGQAFSIVPALYCPGTATTRGQMAALLLGSFGLQ